ncbi:MAG: hypothetical protein ACR5LB_10230 [Wolbachia sp.]
MTMKYEQWKEILSAIDKEADLSKDNVIEKIAKKLEEKNRDEYEKCGEVDFDVNHLFHTVFKYDLPLLFQDPEYEYTLLHLIANDNLGNVANILTYCSLGTSLRLDFEPKTDLPNYLTA